MEHYLGKKSSTSCTSFGLWKAQNMREMLIFDKHKQRDTQPYREPQSPAAHGGPWCSRDPPEAPGGPHPRAGGSLGGCDAVEGLLARLVTLWEVHAGADCS